LFWNRPAFKGIETPFDYFPLAVYFLFWNRPAFKGIETYLCSIAAPRALPGSEIDPLSRV